MKNSLLITVSAVSMLFLSTSSRAEFISTNYLTENDNQIAFDTETGLEWLKLNVTSGKSISNVMELMNNGEYEGFRFATASEVDAIIEKLMPSLFSSEERYLNDPSSFIVDTQESLNFRKTMSNTYSNQTYGYVYTPQDSDSGESARFIGSNTWEGGVVSYYRYDGVYFYGSQDSTVDINTRHNYSGVYLVSTGGYSYSSLNEDRVRLVQEEIDVPTPTLFASFLLLLPGLIRKKKNITQKRKVPHSFRF